MSRYSKKSESGADGTRRSVYFSDLSGHNDDVSTVRNSSTRSRSFSADGSFSSRSRSRASFVGVTNYVARICSSSPSMGGGRESLSAPIRSGSTRYPTSQMGSAYRAGRDFTPKDYANSGQPNSYVEPVFDLFSSGRSCCKPNKQAYERHGTCGSSFRKSSDNISTSSSNSNDFAGTSLSRSGKKRNSNAKKGCGPGYYCGANNYSRPLWVDGRSKGALTGKSIYDSYRGSDDYFEYKLKRSSPKPSESAAGGSKASGSGSKSSGKSAKDSTARRSSVKSEDSGGAPEETKKDDDAEEGTPEKEDDEEAAEKEEDEEETPEKEDEEETPEKEDEEETPEKEDDEEAAETEEAEPEEQDEDENE